MNRRHSQSANAPPVKSLTMSDCANRYWPLSSGSAIHPMVVIEGLIQINGQGGGEYPVSCFQT